MEKWRRSGCQAPIAQIGLRWTPVVHTKIGLVNIYSTDDPSAVLDITTVLAITAVPLLNRAHFGRCVILESFLRETLSHNL